MTSEKRLIDANALIERVAEMSDLQMNGVTIAVAIAKCPTVDAVEVVHGYNIDEEWPSLFECSICHWSCSDTYYGDTGDYNYCPNCGAKMDGDGNG